MSSGKEKWLENPVPLLWNSKDVKKVLARGCLVSVVDVNALEVFDQLHLLEFEPQIFFIGERCLELGTGQVRGSYSSASASRRWSSPLSAIALAGSRPLLPSSAHISCSRRWKSAASAALNFPEPTPSYYPVFVCVFPPCEIEESAWHADSCS